MRGQLGMSPPKKNCVFFAPDTRLCGPSAIAPQISAILTTKTWPELVFTPSYISVD